MDRHVIKGRGLHRGKYLCYANRASGEPAEEDEFVWSPEQSKAARWEDPILHRSWSKKHARQNNGYFVKLIAPPTIDVEDLRAFIAERAKGATDPQPAHWVHGAGSLKKGEGEATNYCRACCEKRVAEILAAHPEAADEVGVDGVGRTEHDSVPYCETCHTKLDASLTDYGTDQEIEAFTDDFAPAIHEADAWYDLDNALIDVSDDDPRWRKIARIVEAARKEGSALPATVAEVRALPPSEVL